MRDYKHFKAQEGAHLTRTTTILIICSLMALFAWMTERDNHPFNDLQYVQVEEQS